ncbi:unnamed protein product, partial [Iphiclides podalirius]
MTVGGGLIQATDTSLTLKGDDGSDIRLAVLKKPIPIDNLVYEQVADDTETVQIDEENEIGKTIDKNSEEDLDNSPNEKPNLTFLKVPICLDDIGDGKELPLLSAKPLKAGNIGCRSSRRCTNPDSQPGQLNAITLFEFAYVYPFVYAGNKFKCFVCSKSFVDANAFREHSLNEHSIEELKEEMNKKVRDKTLKVDVVQLQCKLCNETSTTLGSLKVHLRDHGKQIDPGCQDNIIPFKLGDDTFDCQVCGESFQRLRLLIIHMSKHFNNYNCEICGSVFVSLISLKRHQQTHKAGSYPCEKCNKVFTNSAKRISHIKGVHLKKYTRICPLCPERFNSNYQRTKHLRVVHNQTNMFKCEKCGRQYDLKYHLLLHMRSVHLQERNYECGICHSRFFTKYCLSRHMVVHTGDKKFKCEVCGKVYAKKKSLQEHLMFHELLQSSCAVAHSSNTQH